MTGPAKTLLVIAALAAVPLLAGWAPPQDSERARPTDPLRQEASWSFAVLQYVDARDQLIEVPARNIARLQLLVGPEGDMRMEILYQNRDYASVVVRDFAIIRTSATATATDVPVVRTGFAAMAFPAFE